MAAVPNVRDLEARTPVCNECGIYLCWDISDEEYWDRPDFWDAWCCAECKEEDANG